MPSKDAQRITVEVAPGVASWSFEDTTLEAGVHELKPSKKLRAALAAAVSAGSLNLLKGKLDAEVESNRDSLRKYEAAQKAKAPLFAERDAELHAGGDAVAIVDQYDEKMAAVAQRAVEEIA